VNAGMNYNPASESAFIDIRHKYENKYMDAKNIKLKVMVLIK
jgi:hypothetical protein